MRVSIHIGQTIRASDPSGARFEPRYAAGLLTTIFRESDFDLILTPSTSLSELIRTSAANEGICERYRLQLDQRQAHRSLAQAALADGLKRECCVVALPLGPRLAFFAVHDKSLLEDVLKKKGATGIAQGR
jgi:hypothetical protein